jgi:hypothetical protein
MLQSSDEHSRYSELRRQLIEADPEIGEPSLLNMTNLHDAIIATVRSALEDEDAACRLRGRMDAMEAGLRRIERRVQGKRVLALGALREAGLEHLEADDVRVSVRRAPPLLVITDEDLVPDSFRIERRPPFDLQRIRDALEAGVDVPGAQLADAEPYLSVRVS